MLAPTLGEEVCAAANLLIVNEMDSAKGPDDGIWGHRAGAFAKCNSA